LPVEVRISIADQQLTLFNNENLLTHYSVSTARNGAGEQFGSGCTPRGHHHIRLKIGAGSAINTVFVGRRATGEIYSEALAAQFPDRDWILSRILWLSGDKINLNRGGEVDTLRRLIYIHGTPESEPMGIPRSHGCIRMHNHDLIALFDQVERGTSVLIEE